MEIEENTQPGQNGEPLLELEIRLTKQEILTCLTATSHRQGSDRPIVQTVILLLLFAFCFVSYFMDGRTSTSSLMIAMASLAIIAAMWLVPVWHERFEAKKIASDEPVIRLKLYEKEIVFGGQKTAVIPLTSCKPILCGKLLVLEVGREIVGIPRRIAGEDGFALLLRQFGLSSSNPELMQ